MSDHMCSLCDRNQAVITNIPVKNGGYCFCHQQSFSPLFSPAYYMGHRALGALCALYDSSEHRSSAKIGAIRLSSSEQFHSRNTANCNLNTTHHLRRWMCTGFSHLQILTVLCSDLNPRTDIVVLNQLRGLDI